MKYRGYIKNGVVVFDGPCDLPEGAVVEVMPAQPEGEPPTWGEVFKDLVGQAQDLPTDMARNHDHYLHRAPKT